MADIFKKLCFYSQFIHLVLNFFGTFNSLCILNNFSNNNNIIVVIIIIMEKKAIRIAKIKTMIMIIIKSK